MTPFLTRKGFEPEDSTCARSVRVCPHVCCQVHKSTRYQVSASNTVREATGFRSTPTSIHTYSCSVSCHVPRCSNTMPLQSAPDEIQRVATKHVFQQHQFSHVRPQNSVISNFAQYFFLRLSPVCDNQASVSSDESLRWTIPTQS